MVFCRRYSPHPMDPRPLSGFIAPLRRAAWLGLCLAGLHAAPAWAQPRAAAPEPVTLNFVNADIEAVARAMATLSGRNVVVDPRVKGNLSLSTERPVPPSAALEQFRTALRLQGFALVETSGLYRVVPEADAKLQGSTVNAGPVTQLGGASQIVTQIFRLNHASANNLVPVLRPLIAPNNTINVSPDSNALVITDYADNLQRLGRIVAALDIAGGTDIEIVPLRHAIAADMAPLVQRLLEAGGAAPGAAAQPAAAGDGRTTVVAEPRSNSLVLRAANPARLALARALAAQLDQPGGAHAGGNIHVVYLRNADAVALAATLRAALAGEGAAAGPATRSTTPAGNGATAPVAAAAGPSTGGQIQADPATNALIISAPEPQYRQLRAVIDLLDTRRAQVYVESLIAEVNAEKAAEFGIQWQTPLGSSGDTVVGLLGTNFGNGGRNILSLAAGAASGAVAPAPGFNLGAIRQINGVYVLSALARFLQQNGEANILSTPTLLTLDNQEAKIVIGQNVPFVTGQYTNNNSNNGSVNPFQTIERKDVGLTLRVKPQISENGTIKMTLFQEVSSVLPSSTTNTAGLITNKRSIESTVLVEDGAIVVLGGLLQDEFSGNQDKVPGLGDVPVFGNLFRSESRTRKKTNLMVFLRPVVLRDARDSQALAIDRYDLMRASQQQAQPAEHPLLKGVDAAPVLPARTPLPTRSQPVGGDAPAAQ